MADYPFITPLDERGEPVKEPSAPPSKGLGGWLALFGISLLLGILIKAFAVLTLIGMMSMPEWERLTHAPYPTYDPLWRPFGIFDLTSNSLLLCWNALLVLLFFLKKRLFVPLFILYAVALIAATIADAVFLSAIGNADRNAFNQTIIQIFALVFYALIWIPYLKISVRAKSTFTG
jgi:hypothetical protein